MEAQVRELRLIARHRPPYNRRSKFPDRLSWLKLTREPWPRLSVVKRILDDDADYIGPFGSRSSADDAMAALHDTFRIRQCTPKLAKRSRRPACALAELGHCLSPCDGSVEPDAYAAEVHRVQRAMTADPVELVDAIRGRMGDLAEHERFEDAARWRDRLTALLRAVVRTQRLAELTAAPELVAAAPHADGWEIHVLRHGRLAAAGVMPRGTHPSGWVDALAGHGRDRRRRLRPDPRGHGRGDRVPAALARHLRPPDRPRGVARPSRRRRSSPRSAHRSGIASQGDYSDVVITAIVFIQADVSRLSEIAESIADISGVSEVYSVTGDLDLLAMVRVRTHEEISDVVADQLNKVDGVLSTQTQIAFRTFSHHDLEEAFSIGL